MAGKRSMVRRACALAIVFAVSAAHAQVQPSPTLDLKRAGTVNAIVQASSGRIYIGGDFREVSGVARRNLARFNVDGTLDTSWNPGTDLPVRALRVDAADNLWVGGDFQQVGGVARPYLAKVTAAGAVDATIDAALDGPVADLDLSGDGRLYVAGGFSTAGGQPHASLARLGPDGAVDQFWNPVPSLPVSAVAYGGLHVYAAGADFSQVPPVFALQRFDESHGGPLDPAWAPAPNGFVQDLEYQGGILYVAGDFTAIGGLSRGRLVRMLAASPSGAADPSFDAAPDAPVLDVEVDGAGVFAAGTFTQIGGAARRRMAKLAFDGSAVAGWDADASPTPDLSAIAVNGTGVAYFGGTLNYVGGALHPGIVKLLPPGGADPAFDARVLSPAAVVSTTALSDGGYLVGGDFLYVGTTPRPFVLRLRPDLTWDTSWTLETDDVVSFAREVGGASPLVVGGTFERVDGQVRTRIVRVALDSTPDFAWNPVVEGNSNFAIVNSMHVEGASLFIGGSFERIDGVPRGRLAKLDLASGELDAAWSADTDGFVYSIVGDGAGNLYVGGDFTSIDGVARQRVAKVATAGGGVVDASWVAAAGPGGTFVRRLFYDTVASQLYVAGTFLSMNGNTTFRRLARVSGTGAGALDTAWFPNPTATTRAFAFDPATGWLYFGGSFPVVNGQAVRRLARTNIRTVANGSVDPAWAPNPVNDDPSAANTVYVLAPLAGGGVLAGGEFAVVGGQAHRSVAAIGPDLDTVFRNGYE